MRIENLSKEIDMTAVHGGGDQGIGLIGGGQLLSGGPGSLNIAVLVDPQLAVQVNNVINADSLVNAFGYQVANIVHLS
jgi:hypothetical protein